DAPADAAQQRGGAGAGTPRARNASAAGRGATRETPGGGAGRPARVYKLDGAGKPVAVSIRVGLSDGQRTEVVDGLAENDKVIVGGAESGAPPAAAPGGGQRRGGGRGPF